VIRASEGFCLADNGAGIRVMEKVGMKLEGFLRAYLFQKGAFRDFVVYAMLKAGRPQHGRPQGSPLQ
jgi:ribosomal-protein-alanine N-acetyltransferase